MNTLKIPFVICTSTFVLYCGYKSYININKFERGIIFNKLNGLKFNILDEGHHFIIPFIEKVIIYDISTQNYQTYVYTKTKDLQNNNINIIIEYSPDINNLRNIEKYFGNTYADIIIPPISNEVAKVISSSYEYNEIKSNPKLFKNDFKELLKEKLFSFYINIEHITVDFENIKE